MCTVETQIGKQSCVTVNAPTTCFTIPVSFFLTSWNTLSEQAEQVPLNATGTTTTTGMIEVIIVIQ